MGGLGRGASKLPATAASRAAAGGRTNCRFCTRCRRSRNSRGHPAGAGRCTCTSRRRCRGGLCWVGIGELGELRGAGVRTRGMQQAWGRSRARRWRAPISALARVVVLAGRALSQLGALAVGRAGVGAGGQEGGEWVRVALVATMGDRSTSRRRMRPSMAATESEHGGGEGGGGGQGRCSIQDSAPALMRQPASRSPSAAGAVSVGAARRAGRELAAHPFGGVLPVAVVAAAANGRSWHRQWRRPVPAQDPAVARGAHQ